MPKVMIIGLDGGTFDLIKPWVNEGKLPNIARLMHSGAYCSLRSTIPPMTFPAWNTFMTGKNPGKHGVFDFMERKPGTYELRIMNAQHRKSDTIWKIASNYGKRCAVIGVPVTYPPEEINGVMISGFDAPFVDDRIMYPRELYYELKEKVGVYIVTASFSKYLRKGQIDKALKSLYEAIDRKANTAKYIFKRDGWDLFMIVFGETDAAVHHFWKYHDKNSPQRNGNYHKDLGFDPIFEIYSRVDTHIGELLGMVPEETTVMMMSDHGGGGAGNKVIYVNRFLETQGLLKFNMLPVMTHINKGLDKLKASIVVAFPVKRLKSLLFNPKSMGLKWESKLRFSFVDWPHTKVYAAETPYYPNLRINLKGREPDGIVEKHEYRDIVNRAISTLHEWRDSETGNRIVRKAYSREELYDGDYVENAPDIIVDWDFDNGYSYLSKPSFVSRQGVPIERISAREIEKSAFMIRHAGTHRDEGIFIIAGKNINRGEIKGTEIGITSLGPTILYLLDIPIPRDMDGKVLLCCFEEEHIKPPLFQDMAPQRTAPDYQYTEEETEEVRKKLARMGYL